MQNLPIFFGGSCRTQGQNTKYNQNGKWEPDYHYILYNIIRKADIACEKLKPHIVPMKHIRSDWTKQSDCGLYSKLSDGTIQVHHLPTKRTGGKGTDRYKSSNYEHIKFLAHVDPKECRRISKMQPNQCTGMETVKITIKYNCHDPKIPYQFTSECSHRTDANICWDPLNMYKQDNINKDVTSILNHLLSIQPEPMILCGNLFNIAGYISLQKRINRDKLLQRGRVNVRLTDWRKCLIQVHRKIKKQVLQLYKINPLDFVQFHQLKQFYYNPITQNNVDPLLITQIHPKPIDMILEQGGIADGVERTCYIDSCDNQCSTEGQAYWGKEIPKDQLEPDDFIGKIHSYYANTDIGLSTDTRMGYGFNNIAASHTDRPTFEVVHKLLNDINQKLRRGNDGKRDKGGLLQYIREFSSDCDASIALGVIMFLKPTFTTVGEYAAFRWTEVYRLAVEQMFANYYKYGYGHYIHAIERRTNNNVSSGLKKEVRTTIHSHQYLFYTYMYNDSPFQAAANQIKLHALYYTALCWANEYIFWERLVPDTGKKIEYVVHAAHAAEKNGYYAFYHPEHVALDPEIDTEAKTEVHQNSNNDSYTYWTGDEANIEITPPTEEDLDQLLIPYECADCHFQQYTTTNSTNRKSIVTFCCTNCETEQTLYVSSCNQTTTINFCYSYVGSNQEETIAVATSILVKQYIFTDKTNQKQYKCVKVLFKYTGKQLCTQLIEMNRQSYGHAPNPWLQRQLQRSNTKSYNKLSMFLKHLQVTQTHTDTQSTVELQIRETRKIIRGWIDKSRKQPLDVHVAMINRLQVQQASRNFAVTNRPNTIANRQLTLNSDSNSNNVNNVGTPSHSSDNNPVVNVNNTNVATSNHSDDDITMDIDCYDSDEDVLMGINCGNANIKQAKSIQPELQNIQYCTNLAAQPFEKPLDILHRCRMSYQEIADAIKKKNSIIEIQIARKCNEQLIQNLAQGKCSNENTKKLMLKS